MITKTDLQLRIIYIFCLLQYVPVLCTVVCTRDQEDWEEGDLKSLGCTAEQLWATTRIIT